MCHCGIWVPKALLCPKVTGERQVLLSLEMVSPKALFLFPCVYFCYDLRNTQTINNF